MLVQLRERLTFFNVIAVLALFAALCGGAYAATAAKNSVTSKSIKNGSVKGLDVKDNSLKGTDVNEGSLGTVPTAATAANATSAQSATSAHSADTASNASQVDGNDITKIAFRLPVPSPATVIFNQKGLVIRGDCTATGLSMTADVPAQAHLRAYGEDLNPPGTPESFEVLPQPTPTANQALNVLYDRDIAMSIFYGTAQGEAVSGSFQAD